MGRKWCLDCEQFVNAEKKSLSIPFFIVWGIVLIIEVVLFMTALSNVRRGSQPEVMYIPILLTIIAPFIFYLYSYEGKERCPICNGTNFTETNPKTAKKLEWVKEHNE